MNPGNGVIPTNNLHHSKNQHAHFYKNKSHNFKFGLNYARNRPIYIINVLIHASASLNYPYYYADQHRCRVASRTAV